MATMKMIVLVSDTLTFFLLTLITVMHSNIFADISKHRELN